MSLEWFLNEDIRHLGHKDCGVGYPEETTGMEFYGHINRMEDLRLSEILMH